MDGKTQARLQGILARMDRAATEGEAEAAAAAFQRMLLRLQIDEATARAEAGQPSETSAELVEVRLAPDRTPGGVARLWILTALGESGNVLVFRVGEKGLRAYLVGSPEDIAALRLLYERTWAAFERMARIRYIKARTDRPRVSWTLDYLAGVSSGLRARLEQERASGVEELPGAQALVLVKEDANQRKVEEVFGTASTSSKVVKPRDTGAFVQGFVDGASRRPGEELGDGRTA